MKTFIHYILEGLGKVGPIGTNPAASSADTGVGIHAGGSRRAKKNQGNNKKSPEEVEINPAIGEANINKQDVPVYVPIPGKRGHHKVVGHIRRSATSIGAAKLAKMRTAFKTMKLKSPEFPEGPGWVATNKMR